MHLTPHLILAAAVALTSVAHAQRLLPPQRRATTVELAQKLTAPREIASLPESAENPFAPSGFDRTEQPANPDTTPTAPRERTSREILETIAAAINPTGTMIMRGEPILLFGSRQARVGDQLPVTVNGVAYTLVITAIENTHFTVRLDNEEITRPL